MCIVTKIKVFTLETNIHNCTTGRNNDNDNNNNSHNRNNVNSNRTKKIDDIKAVLLYLNKSESGRFFYKN